MFDHIGIIKQNQNCRALLFLGPISNISVLSEFNRRKLLVIQSFTCLTHFVSLDSLEVSSGRVEIYS